MKSEILGALLSMALGSGGAIAGALLVEIVRGLRDAKRRASFLRTVKKVGSLGAIKDILDSSLHNQISAQHRH